MRSSLAFGTVIISLVCAASTACSDTVAPVVAGFSDGGAFPGATDSGLPAVWDGGVQYVPVPLANDGGPVYDPNAGDGGCGAVRAKTEAVKPPVDVVWLLDGSGSMGPYAASIGTNMLKFMEAVGMSGADINVMMVTGPEFGLALQLAIPAPNYHWVIQEVDSWNAFRAGLDAYPNFKQFLRPDAPTHFVVVTDDSSNSPASEFKQGMEAKLGHGFTFHAVSAGGALGGTSCRGSGDGIEYVNLSVATMGEQIPLCSDWSVVNEKLKSNVVASAPLPCDYPIPTPPIGQTLAPENVHVVYAAIGGTESEFPKAATEAQCLDNLGWYYDGTPGAAPTRVVLCPKACDAARTGGDISIVFACEPPPELR